MEPDVDDLYGISIQPPVLAAIPEADDVRTLAGYGRKFYKTTKAAGTKEEFVED
jgi:hypothetical protein